MPVAALLHTSKTLWKFHHAVWGTLVHRFTVDITALTTSAHFTGERAFLAIKTMSQSQHQHCHKVPDDGLDGQSCMVIAHKRSTHRSTVLQQLQQDSSMCLADPLPIAPWHKTFQATVAVLRKAQQTRWPLTRRLTGALLNRKCLHPPACIAEACSHQVHHGQGV